MTDDELDDIARGSGPARPARLVHVRTGIERRPRLPVSGQGSRKTAYEKKREAAKAKRGGKRQHGRPRGR